MSRREIITNIKVQLNANFNCLNILIESEFNLELQYSFNNIFKQLGLPTQCRVELDNFQIGERIRSRILEMSINGKRCEFSNQLYPILQNHLELRYQYLRTNKVINSVLDIYDWISDLIHYSGNKTVSLSIFKEFVKLLSLEILKYNLHLLITDDLIKEYRHLLQKNMNEESNQKLQITIKDLSQIVTALIERWISIGNYSIILSYINRDIIDQNGLLDIIEIMIDRMRGKHIEIIMEKSYFEYLTKNFEVRRIGEIFELAREALFYDAGLQYPHLKFVYEEQLNRQTFCFKINDLRTHPISGLSQFQLLVNAIYDDEQGYSTSPSIYPAGFGLRHGVITSDYDQNELNKRGYVTWDFIGFLILHFVYTIRMLVYTFVNYSLLAHEMQAEISEFDDDISYQINEDDVAYYTTKQLYTVFPEIINIALEKIKIRNILVLLRVLAMEDISIKNLKYILDLMVEFSVISGCNCQTNLTFLEFNQLLIFIRTRLIGYITNKFLSYSPASIYLLPETTNKRLINYLTTVPPNCVNLQIHKELKSDILQMIDKVMVDKISRDRFHIIVTEDKCRLLFRNIIEKSYPWIVVLSKNEILTYPKRFSIEQIPT